MICILCMEFAMALQVLLLTKSKTLPAWKVTSRGVFIRVQQSLRDNGYFPSVAVQSEREVVRNINTGEYILEMVQRSLRLSTRRMASRIGVSRMQLWRTLQEHNFYPYHDQSVQHLEPGDRAQRMDLCHWVRDHPEILSVILFTEDASFTQDGINNLRSVHKWSLVINMRHV